LFWFILLLKDFSKIFLLLKDFSKIFQMSLNPLQQKAFDIISAGNNLCLSGPAGTGKSFLIRKFIEKYDGLKHIYVTASTGIAATLIDGITLHSFFGIGLAEGTIEELTNTVRKNKKARERICGTDTLFIDEISMISGNLLDILNNISRTLRRSDRPFGGIQVVLVGDFAQLPPINWEKEKFAFQADCWAELIGENQIDLADVIRQSDRLFIDILNIVRRGHILSTEQINILENCKKQRPPPIEGLKPVEIEPYRADVDRINMDCLKKLLTDSANKPVLFEATHIVKGFAQNINIDSAYNRTPLTRKLYVSVGAQVMLIKNLDVENGLCNGSRGIIREIIFNNGTPIGCFIEFIGQKIQIFSQTWKIKMGEISIHINQLPIILSWAITSHKSQGSSIDYAKINAMYSFECGQTYCMLSRIRSLAGLIIEDIDYDKIKCHELVKKFYGWL
jgi:ATP-dependent DNA helicase PIF1